MKRSWRYMQWCTPAGNPWRTHPAMGTHGLALHIYQCISMDDPWIRTIYGYPEASMNHPGLFVDHPVWWILCRRIVNEHYAHGACARCTWMVSVYMVLVCHVQGEWVVQRNVMLMHCAFSSCTWCLIIKRMEHFQNAHAVHAPCAWCKLSTS